MAVSQYRQLTNLPSLYIETEGQRPIASKEQYQLCRLIVVRDGRQTAYDSVQIRGRGNSTWRMAEKKPYRIKFHEKQQLLGDGFADARDWTLLANHGDKSLIRNALTYSLGRFIGLPFFPAADFVDLFVNGEYLGNYQVSDQVQAGQYRVPIDRRTGWLIETSGKWNLERNHFTTANGYTYNIMNPRGKHLSEAGKQDIADWMERMENAVFSEDFADPTRGYRAFIDGESLVDWYVASEITGNLDALLSIYMYRNEGEKMKFGPLWDMDFAYGRSGEFDLLRSMEAFADFQDRPYQKIMQRLWSDPWFARSCKERLDGLIDAGLQDYLNRSIDSLSAHIALSQEQNFKIWPINQPVYSWEKPVYHDTYQEYIDDLKSFLAVHIPFLKEEFRRLADIADKCSKMQVH